VFPARVVDRSERFVAFPDPEFELFFASHYDQLVRSLTAITGDPEQARDCVQESFIKAASRWPKVKRLDSPSGWVRRVAINRSRDLHRSDRRRDRRERLAASSSQVQSTGAEQAVDGSLRLAALLDTLPKRQKSAAVLFYVEDMPVVEIAEVLGISSGAVKFHLSKAREALRGAMEEERQRYG
jgi:RNA polymerase sigma-70 factor (ECF subfamily)